jgi:sugar phosphate isomerase/epimerase
MPGRTWEQWSRRIAFSTNAFKKTSLDAAIRDIARLGYAGCEIMADQPHLTPTELASTDVLHLADVLDALDLPVANVNAFTGFFAETDGKPTGDTYHPTWLDGQPARRETRIQHTLASLRLAAALNAGTVSLQPGGPTIGTGLNREDALKRFADGIRRCLPTARELGVVLAIEPEPGLLLQTTDEYRQWKRDYFPEEPLVSMNFDIGHAFCVGEDPAAVAREMAGEYAHVHLEDIAATRVHQHLVPGEGAIDFASLFAAFDDVGYVGWVTVELYPFMDDASGVAGRAIEHLRNLMSSHGS